MVCRAAIALDIDGTLLKKPDGVGISEEIVQELKHIDAKCEGDTLFINTARSGAYCSNPSSITRQFDADNERHYCWSPTLGERFSYDAMPLSKIQNMDRIHHRMPDGVSKKCAILIDDIGINTKEVIDAGYHAIKVDACDGITLETIKELNDYLTTHCNN